MEDFSEYPRDYFGANRKVMKLSGLWRYDTKEAWRKWFVFQSYNYLCIFLCEILSFPTEIKQISYSSQNFKLFVEHMGILGTHTVILVKTFTFLYHRNTIYKIMDMLESNELRYEPFDDFKPQMHFWNAKKLTTLVTYSFLSAASFVPLSKYAASYFVYFFKYSNEDFANKNITCEEILPYFSWIPYANRNKMACGWALSYQIFPMVIFAWQIIGLDTLFIAVLIYTKAHLKMLCGAFKHIRRRCTLTLSLSGENHDVFYDKESPALDNLMNKEMNRYSKHLQIIIEICDTVEVVFTYGTFLQVIFTVIVMVTVLFMLSTEPLMSESFSTQAFFLVAILYNLGMYCWFSNEVGVASVEIPNAINESEWLPTSTRFRNSMIINICRMQRPLKFTAGKFVTLNLPTFVQILRGSYSYFAFLKNRNIAD